MPALRPAAPDLHDRLLIDLRRRTAELLGACDRCSKEASEPEVHALRLATRHLQAVVQLLGAMHPDAERLHPFRQTLRRILKCTGELRDLQLHLAFLAAHPPVTAWQRMLRRHLAAREANAQRRVQRTLGRIDRSALLATAAYAWPPPPPGRVRIAARAALRERSAKLLRRIRALRTTEPHTLHRARIALKRYRSLRVLLADDQDQREARSLRSLKRLLDRLGEWHDRSVRVEQMAQVMNKGAFSAEEGQRAQRSISIEQKLLRTLEERLMLDLARSVGVRASADRRGGAPRARKVRGA